MITEQDNAYRKEYLVRVSTSVCGSTLKDKCNVLWLLHFKWVEEIRLKKNPCYKQLQLWVNGEEVLVRKSVTKALFAPIEMWEKLKVVYEPWIKEKVSLLLY